MRASTFRSTRQAACCRPTAVRPAQLSRAARQQQQRGYASRQQSGDTPKTSGNLPAFAGIGVASLLTGATTYTIAKGQADVKHNDHAAQAGGEFTQGGEQRDSAAGGLDASKLEADLPGDAPDKPENLAVSEEKMQEKAPSQQADSQA